MTATLHPLPSIPATTGAGRAAAAGIFTACGPSPSDAPDICPVPAEASALERAMAGILAAATWDASRPSFAASLRSRWEDQHPGEAFPR